MSLDPKCTGTPGVARKLAAPASSTTILELNGEFDVFRRDQLNAAFSALASEPYVVVDLSSVTYVDSTILTEMIRLQRFLTAGGGTLIFVGASAQVQRLLNVSGLDRVLDLRTSLADVERDRTLADAKRITISS